MRLYSLDIALNDGEIVSVFFACLVNAIVSRIRRLVRAGLTAETGFWFGFALLWQWR